MGREAFPQGTIRHWQNGDVIKAFSNNLIHSGWIPLATSPTLEEIGRNCDSKANEMIREKTPVNGELFLDREINEFEKDDKGNHPFNPANFKQYEGFYGAGRYSFRNYFSKLFMADKLELAERVTNAMLKANEDAGGENEGDNKKDVLTLEQKKSIRREVEQDYKFNGDKFKVEDAEKLQGIVARTYKQLKLGVNFEDTKEKETYAEALKIADELPKEYQRIGVKRKQKEDILLKVNEVFKDNWGVRESVKILLDKAYGEYVRKFSKQISDDEAKDQEATFGVKLDDDVETFYKALFKKVKEDKEKLGEIDLSKYVGQEFDIQYKSYMMTSGFIGKKVKLENDWKEKLSEESVIKIKDQIVKLEAKYPFKELIYLRFQTLYQKSLAGNWNIDQLPVIYNLEKIINSLPSGHFRTNDDVTVVSNKDFGDKGYAFYSQNAREISFNDKAANAFQIWGDLKGEQEFNSTCTHEIGHAVSKKFGRSGNIDYKKFVVQCGWSYQHLKLSGEQATGDDKDINRAGSNSMSSLLTEYAHKSPEEAFAEYYSIYANNRDTIDKWLDTNNSEVLKQKSQLVVKQKSKEDEKTLSHFYKPSSIEHASKVEQSVNNLNLDLKDHIKLDLINPWHVKYNKEEAQLVSSNENIKHGLYRARLEEVAPIIVVKKKLNEYECIQSGATNEGLKRVKKFAPAIVISEEVYHHLKKQYSDQQVKDYATQHLQNEKVPIQASQPVFKSGIEYRNDILDVKDLVANRERLQLMRHIFNSKALAKALGELFSFQTIRDRLGKHTLVANEQGVEEDILKAKVNSLISEHEECSREIVQLKQIIDNA
jgi:hypothetical protein